MKRLHSVRASESPRGISGVQGRAHQSVFYPGFSGYDPTLGEVIVSHEGTDFEKPQVSVTISIPKFQLISAGSDRRGTSILQNVRVCQVPLDSKLFPGIDQSIRVHKGYAGIQSRYVEMVLSICPSKSESLSSPVRIFQVRT